MHELSVALSIVEGVEEELPRHPASRVSTIHLKIGPLSSVVKDALLFSFEVATQGTALADSTLKIEETPIIIYCDACGCEKPAISIQHIACAACGTPSTDVRRGSELEVYALELVDEY